MWSESLRILNPYEYYSSLNNDEDTLRSHKKKSKFSIKKFLNSFLPSQFNWIEYSATNRKSRGSSPFEGVSYKDTNSN